MFLTDHSILLREFRKKDAKDILRLANNINIAKNLRDGFPYPYTLKDAHRFIKNATGQNPPCHFAIEYQGEYVGNIGLAVGEDVYRQSAEIGYFIGEPYWGNGFATRAVKLLVNYAFTQLKILRIHTGVYDYNDASMKVLEKCGFKKEGIFEKAITKYDNIYDEHRYALINKGL